MDLVPSFSDLPLKSEQTNLLSLVQTPVGEYIVVKHINSQWESTGMDSLDELIGLRGGTYSANIRKGNYTEEIMKELHKMDNIIIDEENKTDMDYFQFPAKPLHELLSKEYQQNTVNELLERYRISLSKIHSDPEEIKVRLPPKETIQEGVRIALAKTIWSQLVKKSAPNILEIDHCRPPSSLWYYPTGILVMDGGVADNCGHGISETFMYKIFAKDDISQKEGVFSYKNIHISQERRRRL